jgi:serine/threonine protein kinase
MNRCPSCGTTYPSDAKYCTRDGSRLVTTLGTSGEPLGKMAARAGLEREPAVVHANLAGTTLDGRYEIVKKIGEGGMSFVYLAKDVVTGARSAIKVLSAALSRDANAMARLRREASLGMRLAHPNICHIVRLGETDDGLVYVVMPYIEGEVLSDRTHRRNFLPPAEVARLVHDIATGLTFAHHLEIVHRDLKPENVMVSRRADGTEYAVVMDFGLAKERRAGAELQKLTATGIVLGTPEFMSPEQLRGRPLDGRTDIYSLALMTCEMLTGKLPFNGRTQQELMIARLRNDPTPLRSIRMDLAFPESLERVLQTAMQRNPDDRYRTPLEFAEAVARATGEDPGGAGDARPFTVVGR